MKKAMSSNYREILKTRLLKDIEIVHIIEGYCHRPLSGEFDEIYGCFLFMEFVTNFIRLVGIQKIQSNSDFKKLFHNCSEEIRRFLLRFYRAYEERYLIYNEYYDKYQIEMNAEEMITTIRFLKIAKDLHIDGIVEDMRELLLRIDPIDIYYYSPEAAYDLFCLVTNDLEHNYMLRDGFRRIYYEKNRDLPVKFYWKLRDKFGNSGKAVRPFQKNNRKSRYERHGNESV